jgi:4-amino-4-deoxy-L-arabinose transferase-like glycosyltransferase
MRKAKILRFPKEQVSARPIAWWERLSAVAGVIFAALLLTHLPLLSLPYFWDEAGYYIPAAHDLFANHQLIPTSTLSNAHPPLVMVWLSMMWSLFGYHAAVTRIAMLLVSTFTLVGVFRLARHVANSLVAVGALICTAVFPVFFAQSTLAHLDMAAAGFTIWGIFAYISGRQHNAAIWFSLAALSKETAILAPLALAIWELLGLVIAKPWFQYRASWKRAPWLLLPLAPLAVWFAYHYRVTGFMFGNPDFLRYNVSSTLHPVRVLAALAQRLWQLFGYMNLFVLTMVALLAMTRKARTVGDLPQNGTGNPAVQRPRIAIPVQITFAVVVIAYVLALSVVGGAVLARYLLPVYPLLIIVFVSTIWRRLPMWQAFLAVVCFAFVLALMVNPPYHFAPEDNLAYADFVDLHRRAAKYLEKHPPQGHLLTAWPASDELTKPYLGYVSKPMEVLKIEDFSVEQIMAARDQAELYGSAFLFSTKYEPSGGFLIQPPFWRELQKRYFDYHLDVPPETAAQMLGGDVVWEQKRGGQWAAILEMKRAVNARLRVAAFE